AALQVRRADALGGEAELVLRDGDAGRVDAVVLRGVHREGSPTAADVEETLARLQPQLGANVVELGDLRLLERVPRRAEVSARVHHARVEPQLVELVGDVVMVRDRGAVDLLRVARIRGAGRVEQRRRARAADALRASDRLAA